MELINQYIELLLNGSTPEKPLWNIEAIHQGKKAAWNYVDGCMMTSLLSLYRQTGEKRYFDFVENFIDFYVADDGSLLGYEPQTFNLDDICESRVLFDLYQKTNKEKYLKAIHLTYKQVLRQPRTKEGSFWHKLIYPQQVWLDGLFMAQPFYTRYESFLNNNKNYNDILNHFKVVRNRMFNETHRLYYHGYDASKTAFWANKETGLSSNFWLRATGWYVVAIIDVIEHLDDTYLPKKTFFFPLLKEAIDGLLQYQDKSSKLFYQVINRSDLKNNYLESSGSSLIAYAILKAVRLGVLDQSYQQIGLDIFNGIYNTFIKTIDGKLNMSGICLVAGLGPDHNLRRDGSIEYYLSEPVVENDAKGVGPFIMAYTEYLESKK